VLLLVNYRPEYSHAWTNESYYTQLRLDALGRESAAEKWQSLSIILSAIERPRSVMAELMLG
jgi:hypothetical protein